MLVFAMQTSLSKKRMGIIILHLHFYSSIANFN
jgi:hypothetical protein